MEIGFETGFTQLNVLQWENFEISQVGEALEEDLSSGGVEGTQLLAHQYIFHLINRSHQLNKQIDTVGYTKDNFNGWHPRLSLSMNSQSSDFTTSVQEIKIRIFSTYLNRNYPEQCQEFLHP